MKGLAVLAALAAAMLMLQAALAAEAQAPPEAIPTCYKIVVEQYLSGKLLGSTESKLPDTPGAYGVQF
jgi:hypothetical protein